MSSASKNKSLLVELLVEELPPKSLKQLGQSFGTLLFEGLQKLHHLGGDAQLTTFASPRRLAAHVTNVREIAVQKPRKIRLMPVSVGLNADGSPTPSLLKKCDALGLGYLAHAPASVWEVKILRENDGKLDYLFYADVAEGLPLSVNLLQALQDSIQKLPIGKAMTYQLADGWSSVSFVRPAHGLVALHGTEIVAAIEVLGLIAGNTTKGHRFEANSKTIELRDADSYEQQLESEGAVIASFERRRNEIIRQLEAATAREGLNIIKDEVLLDEVTALVERPNVLTGEFEREFLEVPRECLVLTMKMNQKYFPLSDKNGNLSHKFLIVSNIRPANAAGIVTGNERVLRSRLSDAKFFFDQDRKKTLASRVEGLRGVVYHHRLGTQAERVERIWAIAQAIGLRLGGPALAAQAGEAAMLSKADLLTDMVGEFPELQGAMGRYYAKHDGLADDVADAIEDHYKPRFAGDELPRNTVGVCVALADKLETLVGMFGIGQVPTGDKDPFALRRHALGVIRILVEKKVPLSLDILLEQTADTFGGMFKQVPDSLNGFIYERLRHYFSMESLDEQAIESRKRPYITISAPEGIFSPQEIEAVLALRPSNLSDIKERLCAVHAFAALPDAESLAATNKRVGNILKKADIDIKIEVNPALLQAPAEQALHLALSQVAPQAENAFSAGDYNRSLQILAALKRPVDDFFDSVMVNTEDEALRHNRLALLAQLQQAMNRVADISRLAV
ncbi:MAG: glycine--tRNA ligase subunit beta [Nitrosospira sp.]|nr:glycine--tRNA ligase subunit beta [Nitrosospira sp.]